ncbi:gliding motility-associated C-terminal domain-containing protein [Flavobacterium sp.]|uniref:gliding motility-associated C-terminal domain-containing protein n=1 Tax=Flavobacterium sp. TaxID=239 RepID=UPI002B4AD1F1|nr:gliding motility-associated C-terminal domain-containing protein [Flavobacterium sp.]HLP64609.1 gliding motility-associated C-terminal domain-containing protein [Flavobacterium sp.]
MKKTFTLVLLLFLTSLSYSQEICDNALDDDGDGLIDLNDSDCSCSGELVNVPSLIPNPSFEEMNYCPDFFSQLDAATSWIQATDATTDYFNTCGYGSDFNAPFGDGEGMVGAIFSIDWQEYLGTCLSSPMVAGTNYQLQFMIYSSEVLFDGDFNYYPPIGYSPLDITLYGSSDCNNLPISTTGCPSNASPNWVVLGSANYTPIDEWGIITINFTPTQNINTIILGSPCTLSPEYEDGYVNGILSFPYFLFDNLLLNQSELFNDVTISTTGDFCSNNVVLNSTVVNQTNPFTYQWYVNGVAILGATSSTYSVASYTANDVYSLRIVEGENCYLSNSLQLNSIVPSKPTVVSPLTYCQNDTATPLSANGTNLLWYTTATGGTGSASTPTPSTSQPGTFSFYVSQTCQLESPREVITVVVNPLLIPDFPTINQVCFGETTPVLNSVSPNGIAGTWLPSTISSTESGSYVFTPASNVCAYSQTLNINVIQPIQFSLIGGCSNENYYLEAIPNSSFDLNNLTFQWFDYNGNPIGTNQTIINLTEIVNATPEYEDFPLTYGLTISDNFGCETTATYEIEKVYCKIPKGISPNEDNQNDFFDLRGLHVTHLDIFNRYGMKVYDLDNYTTEWKGQSKKGEKLPDGTYYYYIEFENENPKTGWVYLQKND